MLWAIAIALSILGLAGLVLTIRGRRINDHPVCRKCRFDLDGVWPPPEGAPEGAGATGRCPECGSELGRARATRAGARRRRPALIAACALILAAGLSWTGVLVVDATSSVNWNTFKPTWMLMLEARHPTNANADAGMLELTVRLGARALTLEQVNTITERILEAQANPDLPWHGSWGDFIETAHVANLLPPEQLEQYLRQAVEGHITPHDLNYMNDSLRFGVQLAPRAGTFRSPGDFKARAYIDTMEIDQQGFAPGVSAFLGMSGRSSWTSVKDPITLPAGDLEVTMRGRIEILDDYNAPAPITSWPMALTTTLHVDPDASITWIDDPALAPVFNRSNPQTPTARATENGARVDGFLHFESVPVGTVADVFFRDGDREWRVGRIILSTGYRGGHGFMANGVDLPGFDARTVDIIFRTVTDEEPDANWPAEVWRGELVIPDVPIQWR